MVSRDTYIMFVLPQDYRADLMHADGVCVCGKRGGGGESRFDMFVNNDGEDRERKWSRTGGKVLCGCMYR